MPTKKTPTPAAAPDLRHYKPLNLASWESAAATKLSAALTHPQLLQVDLPADPTVAAFLDGNARWVAWLDQVQARTTFPDLTDPAALPTLEACTVAEAANTIYSRGKTAYEAWVVRAGAAAAHAAEARVVGDLAPVLADMWSQIAEWAPSLPEADTDRAALAALGKERYRQVEDMAEAWGDLGELVRVAYGLQGAPFASSHAMPGLGLVPEAHWEMADEGNPLPTTMDGTVPNLLHWARVARDGHTVRLVTYGEALTTYQAANTARQQAKTAAATARRTVPYAR
ncbi:hypothetical protein ACF3NS_15230 [Arsenicicoccus cauae]|uniref:hypothetical protein n=1 Tax=Arsenicicoccus cauae TaxID=2663847 RepID=UPI00370D6ED9